MGSPTVEPDKLPGGTVASAPGEATRALAVVLMASARRVVRARMAETVLCNSEEGLG